MHPYDLTHHTEAGCKSVLMVRSVGNNAMLSPENQPKNPTQEVRHRTQLTCDPGRDVEKVSGKIRRSYSPLEVSSLEEFLNLLHHFHETVHLVPRVVEIKTRPRGGLDAQPVHEGLGAMMAAA